MEYMKKMEDVYYKEFKKMRENPDKAKKNIRFEKLHQLHPIEDENSLTIEEKEELEKRQKLEEELL